MTASRALLTGLLVITAAVLQTVVLVRLPLPYGRPDLVLVLVAAIAMAAGSGVGMSVGFAAGLVCDLLADHPAGMLALVLCLVGYACGLVPDARDRGVLLPLGVVVIAAAAAALAFAVLLAIVGSPRLDWHVVGASLPACAAYDVILAAFVVPLANVMYRRLDARAR
ncbi:MAG: rod shape-determining protein MreD [Actinomycetota bacterium]|nr:rod shape-determining protein MreD [Actinomycetota bacterium]